MSSAVPFLNVSVANSVGPGQTQTGYTLFLCMPKLENDVSIYMQQMGAQWLSGRVLDSRRSRWFEPHCVVSLSKTY